jgi:hypothetical protein
VNHTDHPTLRPGRAAPQQTRPRRPHPGPLVRGTGGG